MHVAGAKEGFRSWGAPYSPKDASDCFGPDLMICLLCRMQRKKGQFASNRPQPTDDGSGGGEFSDSARMGQHEMT